MTEALCCDSKSKVSKALWNCFCCSWQHCCVCCFPHSPTPSKRAHTEIGRILAWQHFVMEILLSTTAKCEVRAIIQVLNAEGNTPIEIHHQLRKVYGESCIDIKSIRKWCREFTFGRSEIHDEERSGRPSTCKETVAKVEESLRKDRRVSPDDLYVSIPEVSRTVIYRILRDMLQYRKVCAI